MCVTRFPSGRVPAAEFAGGLCGCRVTLCPLLFPTKQRSKTSLRKRTRKPRRMAADGPPRPCSARRRRSRPASWCRSAWKPGSGQSAARLAGRETGGCGGRSARSASGVNLGGISSLSRFHFRGVGLVCHWGAWSPGSGGRGAERSSPPSASTGRHQVTAAPGVTELLSGALWQLAVRFFLL